jgi:LacI family transcriptional regulator
VAVIAEAHWEDPAGWNYYGEMIRGVLGLAPRLRVACEVLTLDSPEDRPRLEDSREMRRFSGFISVAVIDRGLLSWLAGLGRGPVVLLDHQIRDLPVVSVVDGSFEGARAVTRHLLRLGHRRIGFLDHHNRAESNSEKHAGYAAALAEAGIGTDERLVVVPPRAEWVPPGSPEIAQIVEAAVERLLALDEPPTALFGFDDYRALPAIEALERRGRRVGRDFAVAGFGDSAFQKGCCDRLTSSRINVRRMGQEALRAALSGEKSGGGRTIIVPTRLMIRETSRPPPMAGKETSHA